MRLIGYKQFKKVSGWHLVVDRKIMDIYNDYNNIAIYYGGVR